MWPSSFSFPRSARRKPRWVIEEDRLVYVERDADELAEIPFEAVFNFDLVKCAGVWHVEIVLREPLDWTAFLSKRFFPVVRRIPGREWALLVLTARESPPVILEMLRTRLKAYRARGELE